MTIQSKNTTWRLTDMLEKHGFKYRHISLLYVGSFSIDFSNKTFFPMAVSIYPKKTDEEILLMLKDNT